MLQDTLNDALVIMKNAQRIGKPDCNVKASKLIGRILQVMKEYNYIENYEFVEDGRGGIFRVKLNGNINNCGVIKPRFSVKKIDYEKWEARYLPGQDFGVLILTTTAGIVSHYKAKEMKTGGKLLAYVY